MGKASLGFAAALFPVFLAGAALSSPAHASTPALIWQGVSNLRVQCLVETEAGSGPSAFQTDLCDRIARLARRGAPYEVQVIGLGDPQVIAPGTVALLVHASVQPGPAGTRLLAFGMRPFRAAAEQNAVLFGTAPRAVALPASGRPGPELDAALRPALARLLPWQALADAPRPLVRPSTK